MKFLSSWNITTGLLAAIAVLLLVLVVRDRPGRAPAPMGEPMAMTGNMPGHNHPPMEGMPGGGMPPAGMPPMQGSEGEGDEGGNFHPSNMLLSALVCPGSPGLTLGDPSCQGGEANARRKTVDDALAAQSSIRAVFDTVIAKYGEDALTAQAREIRRARKAAQGQ